MAMPPCGTFDYAVVVPRRPQRSRCVASSRDAWWTRWSMDPLFRQRLVGYSPRVQVSDGRVTLTAPGRWLARVRSASLRIGGELAELMAAGDVLHLTRTSCAGLAVALHRGSELLVAVGAVTSVPLGPGIAVRSVSDDELAPWDAGEPPHEAPVDITVSGHRQRLLPGETSRLGAYEVHLARGWLWGLPGTDESVAIVRPDCLPLASAVEAALRLSWSAELQMVSW